jgi:hypothetical protein
VSLLGEVPRTAACRALRNERASRSDAQTRSLRTTSESTDRNCTDACFVLAKQASGAAGSSHLVLVQSGRERRCSRRARIQAEGAAQQRPYRAIHSSRPRRAGQHTIRAPRPRRPRARRSPRTVPSACPRQPGVAITARTQGSRSGTLTATAAEPNGRRPRGPAGSRLGRAGSVRGRAIVAGAAPACGSRSRFHATRAPVGTVSGRSSTATPRSHDRRVIAHARCGSCCGSARSGRPRRRSRRPADAP